MDISTEEFLEHYGVKGMHWGIRKDPDSASTSPKKPKKKMPPEAKRMYAVLAASVAVGLGSYFLRNKIGAQTIRSIPRTSDTITVGRSATNRLVGIANSTTSVSSFRNADGSIPLGPAKSRAPSFTSRSSELRDITAKSNELRRLANADLRRMYDQTQTPFPDRQFL